MASYQVALASGDHLAIEDERGLETLANALVTAGYVVTHSKSDQTALLLRHVVRITPTSSDEQSKSQTRGQRPIVNLGYAESKAKRRGPL